ncbi:MAG: NAD-dependent epimerase/dehydratase family protein [Anaerolineales bacterium]|uniref:NAD-dependent epimerase/dehydratase family protein n=1 Tax=Candidatus Desulfolinea nitratireducens TaxID=2841698 RepID=A0A8J6NMR8_9CHLR|nr:NAD-dependent epimerase/dehydratase family protein [Candidatus Desulfolinea nitratireducens]MBL6959659.1 NAD-dependent epimerase/dehydratase family protein [Anaerolineales bacterium]
MTRALVTGGTGFIGSNIALRLIERHWDVRILERSESSRELLEGGPFEFVIGNVLEPDSLLPAMEGIDVVFHAAGVVDYWNQGEEHMYKVNVDGTRNVMEAALKSGIDRVVHISSTAAMGIHPNEIVDESYTFNVEPERFIYGHSKYLAEEIAFEYIEKGLPVVLVNPTTVIGPRDVRKVSSGMVVEVGNHHVPPFIPPGGINIIPICDAAQGAIEAVEKGHVGERYILGGENISHLQLYKTITNVVGCGMKLKAMPRWQVSIIASLTDMLQPQTSGPVPLTGDRLRLEAQFFFYETTKARTAFDMPQTPLRITIGRTYEWYDLMGEFEGTYESLEENGTCKYCKRSRYCEWPPQPEKLKGQG